MTAWQTTVDHLMLTFRDALRALVPHVERARIEWRDGSAYDDWDEIAQTLYEKIVVGSVRWAMPEHLREASKFPHYNMTYDSYAEMTVVVVNRIANEERLVFHSFATETEPFDQVRLYRVGKDGRAVEGDPIVIDVGMAAFSVEAGEMMLAGITVDV